MRSWQRQSVYRRHCSTETTVNDVVRTVDRAQYLATLPRAVRFSRSCILAASPCTIDHDRLLADIARGSIYRISTANNLSSRLPPLLGRSYVY